MTHQKTNLFVLVGCVLAIVFIATDAFAQTTKWENAFTPELISTQWNNKLPSAVMVVTPTDTPAETTLAQAFTEALYASGIPVVEGDGSLGDIAKLSDDKIWKTAASSSPASIVFIVRIQSATPPMRGLIKAKRSSGFSGLTVVDGQPAVNWKTDAETPPAVSTPTPDQQPSNEPTATTKPTVVPDPVGIFLRRDTEADRREESIFQTGQLKPMSYDAFYRAVGRDELADRYRSTRALKTTVFIGSGTAAALGIGVLFVGLVQNSQRSDDSQSLLLPVIGGSLIGLGGVGIVSAFFIDQFPTSTEEDDGLIDAHNQTQLIERPSE